METLLTNRVTKSILAKTFVNNKQLILEKLIKQGVLSKDEKVSKSKLISAYTNTLSSNQEFQKFIATLVEKSKEVKEVNSYNNSAIAIAVITGITSLLGMGTQAMKGSQASSAAQSELQAEILRLEAEKEKKKRIQYLIIGGVAISLVAIAGVFYFKTKNK